MFLSDNYDSGWNAYVDGIRTKVYRTDYSFRSIVVPSGEHTIVFVYQPFYVKIGAYVSIISFVILIIISLLFRKYYEKK